MGSMNEDFLFLQESVSGIVMNSKNPDRTHFVSKQVIQKEGKELERAYRVGLPGIGVYSGDTITGVLVQVMRALDAVDGIEPDQGLVNAREMSSAVRKLFADENVLATQS